MTGLGGVMSQDIPNMRVGRVAGATGNREKAFRGKQQTTGILPLLSGTVVLVFCGFILKRLGETLYYAENKAKLCKILLRGVILLWLLGRRSLRLWAVTSRCHLHMWDPYHRLMLSYQRVSVCEGSCLRRGSRERLARVNSEWQPLAA